MRLDLTIANGMGSEYRTYATHPPASVIMGSFAMKPLRFSIRSICFLVLVVALDFVLARHFLRPSLPPDLHADHLEFPFLGMANILAVAGYCLLTRPTDRPILATFVVCGLLGSAACAAYLWAFPYLGGLVTDWISPFMFWFANSGNINYYLLYITYYGVVTLVGTLILVVLTAPLAVLVRLVVRRRLPWFVAVVLIIVLVGSASLRLRWLEFRELATRYEETGATLSHEISQLQSQFNTIKSLSFDPKAPTATEVSTMEEITRREAVLAQQRRYGEKYRRAMSRPWLPVKN